MLRLIIVLVLVCASQAVCTTSTGITTQALCTAQKDTNGFACCWWQVFAAPAVSGPTPNTGKVDEGNCVELAWTDDTRVDSVCTSATNQDPGRDTDGFCFDYGAVDGTTGRAVNANATKYSMIQVCKHAVVAENWVFGPYPLKATAAATNTVLKRNGLLVKLKSTGGCTCSKRDSLLNSGVDKACQASYLGGTAGTYKASTCEAIADNSGASTKCCSATFGSASTVLAASCKIGSTVCSGLKWGNVYCFGKSSVLLLAYVDNSADTLGFAPSDICVSGSGTASTAFPSVSPIVGTGTGALGATGATTSKATGMVQCTSTCAAAASASSTAAAAATTAATSATSESYIFILGFSLFAVFAPLLK